MTPKADRRHGRRFGGAVGVAALAALAVWAAPAGAAPASGTTAAAGGGTFVLTNLSDPDPIDPALTSHTMSRTFERNVYEALVYYQLGTTKLTRVLAIGWKVSKNGRVYTFDLRRNVRFHNGQRFTAADVKATFERDLKLPAGVGGSYLRDLKSVAVVNPYRVRMTLKRPYAFFLGQLPKIGIVSAADVRNHAGSDNAQGWYKNNANGTGPWKLQSYERGRQYTLVRHTRYWRPFRDKAFDKIIVRPVADSVQQAQLIQRGEVNMGSWMAVRDMVNADKSGNVQLIKVRSPMTLIGALNGGRPPLDKLKVRQAIIAAFPYARLAQFYQGYAQIPRNVLSPAFPGSAQFPEFKQDLTAARRLLSEAGYPNGRGFPKIRYVAVQGLEDERQAGLLLQDALKQIGVDLQIDVLPFSTFFAQAQKVETAPDISPGYEAPETNDAFQWFAKLFKTDGFLNFSHFGNRTLDRLIDQAQLTKSPARRTAMLRQAQTLIANNAFAIPMSNFDAVYAASSFVGGFKQDITDLLAVPKFFDMYRK